MAGQGRTLLILGGVLAAAVGAVIWMVTSAGTDDGPGPAADAPPASADGAEPPKRAVPAAARARKAGTAAILGEIRRTAGKAPVANQEVVLTPERGDPWTVTTDAEGAFRFDKIPHGGPYELSAAAKGCATIRIPGMALDRNEQRNVGTLFLDPAVKLTVRVRSYADQPVEGAVVEAFPIQQVVNWDWSKALAQIGQAPVSVARASTDAAGEAVFPETAAGSWTFVAKKDGFAPGGARSVAVRSGEEPKPVTIHLAKGHPLDGRVLGPDRQPVAGALVMAGAPNSAWDFGSAPLRARVTADAEGRYAFAALEPGELMFWVARPGGIPAPAVTVRVPLVPHYDIVLKGSGSMTGIVTEKETGKPVEGATVRVTSWESGTTRGGEAVSDAEGKYVLEMTAGALNRIVVEKEGLIQVPDEARPGMNRAAVLPEGGTVTKNLQMRHGARLSGVVKGPAGPLAGARVSASRGSPTEGSTQKYATTGADGRYEFPAIEKGSVLVLATKEGHYLPGAPENWWQVAQDVNASKEMKVEIPETGEATRDLEMRAGSVVEGVVLGPDGAPLGGVRVSGQGASQAAPTAADGKFRLEGVTPGPAVRVWCSKDGYTSATNSPVAVVADQPTTNVTLRMMVQARVRGTVTTASGAPLSDARVLLARKNAGQDNPWEETNRWQSAVRVPVKPDGTFDAPMPFGPPGILLVRAVSLDQSQADAPPMDIVEGRESYDVTLSLTDGADLAGVVVSKAGGAPVAGADVSISPTRVATNGVVYGLMGNQAPVWAVTDAAGAFRVPHLAPGAYDVRVAAAGFVVAQARADLAEGKPVTIEMSPELTIEGTVTYADGRPVEGAEVHVTGASRQQQVFSGMIEQQQPAVTDGKGSFRAKGIADGKYTLTVQVPWGGDLNIRPKKVEGVPGGATGVKIVVEAGAVISGRVVDSQRRPIASAWISANPMPRQGVAMNGEDWRNAQTKADGTFTVTGLGDGPYHLQVNAQMMNGSAASYRPVQVDDVAVGAKDLEIVMEDGLSITGVVVDERGGPVSQLSLQIIPVDDGAKNAQQSNGWTDQDGKFTAGGLVAGNYRIEVAQWGGPNQGYVIDPPVIAAAGTAGLRIVVTKGISITGSVTDEAGRPIDNVSLYAMSKKGGHRPAQAKGDGTFEISGLQSGESYTVTAQAQGRVNAQVEDVVAGSKDVRLVLPKGLECTGRLTDAAGKAMASTWISFTHSDGKHTQWTQTDAEGKFTAGGLVEGTHEAKVYVQKADNTGGDWKQAGSLKAGDRDVELRLTQ